MEQNEMRARHALDSAHRAWERMADFRARRRRYVRYTYGDQWSDMVHDHKGKLIPEREKLTYGDRTPLSNNLIRRLVKAVVGRYRHLSEDASARAGEAGTLPDDCVKRNNLHELDARTLEEFLISGMAVHHVWRERRPGGGDVWVDNVPPDRFFISHVTDPRCTDTELVGRLLDMSIGEVMMRFARGDRRRAIRLKELYASLGGGATAMGDYPAESGEVSFFNTQPGRCRVIEVWSLECSELLRCHDPLTATFTIEPAENQAVIDRRNRRRRRRRQPEIVTRWEIAPRWQCRFMAPDGTVLDSFTSPLPEGGHPFALKLYPLVDGEVHSLVEDVIDQQRHVNRLITLMDHMMGTAAKGVLLFPTTCKIEGQEYEQLASMWSDPGSVIPYNPMHGHEPHQVVTPASDIGARDMLQTQIKLFEEVSGVGDSLLGRAAGSGVGLERYESEVRNASIAVNDLLKTFADFASRRNELVLGILS